MPALTIRRGGQCHTVAFEGEPTLLSVLQREGFSTDAPCGGRGVCGKCRVLSLTGAVSEPTRAEELAGVRLSCQARLTGDCHAVLPEAAQGCQIELEGQNVPVIQPVAGRYGVAIDIGTTTVAARLYDLQTGACVWQGGMLNPQASVAGDVMGRIDAALHGQAELLQTQICHAITQLLQPVEKKIRGENPIPAVITGNTTMLYLLTGRNPLTLSAAPFEADCLFGLERYLPPMKAFLPRCMNAFVGADITCAVLSCGMCDRMETSLLCDIGTNGEIALWRGGHLYVTSTAAGPAFEGAGISCGCGSKSGAVDRAWVEDGQLRVHTIDDAIATGLCGSGLIDVIAAGLQLEEIDETGALNQKKWLLTKGVALQGEDVRAVQLAKAAIAAGIHTLLEEAGADVEEIETLYIAGGFGSHLNAQSAAVIGLIPTTLLSRAKVLGNAALTGAAMLLMNESLLPRADALAASSYHVNLGGGSLFGEFFVEHMTLEAWDGTP